VLSTRVGKKWCGEIGYVSQLPSSGFLVQASTIFNVRSQTQAITEVIIYPRASLFHPENISTETPRIP